MQSVRVVYIGGYGRSGSTLLGRLLGCAPGASFHGELTHIWERGYRDNDDCGCGAAFRSCPFWGAVMEECFGSFGAVPADEILALRRDADRVKYIPLLASYALGIPVGSFAARIEAYGAVVERLYRAIARVSGRGIIVDSSKEGSYAFVLRSQPEIDVSVVHLVRDSRAVAFSWNKRVMLRGREGFMPRYPAVVAGHRWNIYNLTFHALDALSVSRTLVRYEDFVSAPRPTLDRLAHLVEAEPRVWNEAFLDDNTVQLAPAHSVSGNSIRMDRGPIRLRLDDEWRATMPARARTLVTGLTWPLMIKYGYL